MTPTITTEITVNSLVAFHREFAHHNPRIEKGDVVEVEVRTYARSPDELAIDQILLEGVDVTDDVSGADYARIVKEINQ